MGESDSFSRLDDTLRRSTFDMWLPTPLYESLPYGYLVIGVLIVGGVAYHGSDLPGAAYYGTIGMLSIIAGVAVLLRRKTARQKNPDSELSDDY